MWRRSLQITARLFLSDFDELGSIEVGEALGLITFGFIVAVLNNSNEVLVTFEVDAVVMGVSTASLVAILKNLYFI